MYVRNYDLDEGSVIFDALKPLSIQLLLHLREQKKKNHKGLSQGNNGGRAKIVFRSAVFGVGDQLNTIFFPVVQSGVGVGGMNSCIVT